MITLDVSGRLSCDRCGNVWTPVVEGRLPRTCPACSLGAGAHAAAATFTAYLAAAETRPLTNLLRTLRRAAGNEAARRAQREAHSKRAIATAILLAREERRTRRW